MGQHCLPPVRRGQEAEVAMSYEPDAETLDEKLIRLIDELNEVIAARQAKGELPPMAIVSIVHRNLKTGVVMSKEMIALQKGVTQEVVIRSMVEPGDIIVRKIELRLESWQ